MEKELSSDPKIPAPIRGHESLCELVWKLIRRANENQNFEAALEEIFISLRSVIPFDRLGIALLEDDGKVLRSRWVQSSFPVKHLGDDFSAPVAGSSLESVMRSGRPRIIEDTLDYLAAYPASQSTRLIVADGIRSSLTFPLVVQSRTLGVVFFSSREPRTYGPHHIQLFAQVSEALAVIVEQADLRKESDVAVSKAQTVRMVVHDLKSSLNVVQGFLSILPDQAWFPALDAESREMFAALRRNSESMGALLGELSDIVQIKGDASFKLMRKDVHLRQFLSEFAAEADALAGLKGITFVCDFDRNLPQTAWLDPIRIRQVLLNLLTNAVKFSYPGTEIDFEASIVPGALRFEMTDHGQGIRPEELVNLFQWQGRTSTRPTGGETSTGLGLLISKKIVEAHGGSIEARSEFHTGSRFSFTLPQHSL